MGDEIKLFNHEEFGELEVLLIDRKEYFPASDVAKVLGYKNPRDAIAKHCKLNGSITKKRTTAEGNVYNKKYIDYINTLRLIQKSRTATEMEKEIILSFIETCCKSNVGELREKHIKALISRDEIEFVSLLEGVLDAFGYETHRQYKIGRYFIDFYIEDLKLAIEYDENNHRHYSRGDEEYRQQYIEKALGCSFLRVSDKKSHAYNVGLIMKSLVIDKLMIKGS